jgi:signal transduction histidine kinase
MPDELAPICDGLNQLLARLQNSFTEINHYAGKVAHELRTPLAILRLKIEQAGDRIAPELAEELQAELHQLSHVVDQSLFIARAEQGRIKAQPQTFDLAELVADVAEDFSLVASEGSRRVRLETDGQPVPVFADPKYVRQIIHNLLANAWKHGRGDIWLRLQRGRLGGGTLAILNQIQPRAAAAEGTLGLGLRVVDSLLALQPAMKCHRRAGKKYYAARLRFS